MSNTSFHILLQGLKATGHSLHVPEIVVDEVKNKHREKLRECREKIDKQFAEARRLIDIHLACPIDDDFINNAVKNYSRLFDEKLSAAGAKFWKYPDIPLKQIAQRSMLRRKPFSTEDKGYRDCLIWETILQVASISEEPVAFITANYKDFANAEGKILHSDLLEDLKELGIESARVMLFTNFKSFVDKQVKTVVKSTEEPQVYVTTHSIGDEKLQVDLTRELEEQLVGEEFESGETGFPIEFEFVTLSGIMDISRIAIESSEFLSTGEELYVVRVDAECDFGFLVRKNVLQALSHREPFEVWDPNWTNDYVVASAPKMVSIKASMIYDQETSEVTSTELISMRPVKANSEGQRELPLE